MNIPTEKLMTIKRIADKGIEIAIDELSMIQFQQIAHEIKEVLGEVHGKKEEKTT